MTIMYITLTNNPPFITLSTCDRYTTSTIHLSFKRSLQRWGHDNAASLSVGKHP